MKTKFSSGQLFRLFFLFTLGTYEFTVQHMFQLAEYEGWISIIIGSIGSVVLAYFAVHLAKRHPNQEWIDYGKRLLGRWLHGFFIWIVVLFCLTYSAVSMQQLANLFVSIYYPTTPDYILTIGFMFCVAVLVSNGLKSIIYTNDILWILMGITVTFFSGIILAIPEWDYSMFRMIFHFDWHKINYASLFALNWTGDVILFLFLAPEFKTKKSPMVALVVAVFASCLIIVEGWMFIFLEVGFHVAKRVKFPVVEFIRFVSTGDFFRNIDHFPILFALCCLTFTKLCLLLYIATKLLTGSFRVKKKGRKYFLYILVVLSSILAIVFSNNAMFFEDFVISYYFQGFLLFIKLIPLIYLIVYGIRKLAAARSLKTVKIEVTSEDEKTTRNTQ